MEGIPFPAPLPTPAPQLAKGESPRFKYRIRFRKAGELRFVSHHDLMHVVERMFRRADLRLCVTQGFNPRPKMAFALSLALGVPGLNEVLEIETVEAHDADALKQRLQSQCPPGLVILSIRTIEFRTSAQVRRARYQLSVAGIGDLIQRCDTFLRQTDCWFDRTRPNPRRVNLRPFVSEMRVIDDTLEIMLWITPTGAARPEEVIHALGLSQLLENGGVIERADLDLYDEAPPGAEAPPPALATAIENTTVNDKETPAPSRMTAIVDSPMSFDT